VAGIARLSARRAVAALAILATGLASSPYAAAEPVDWVIQLDQVIPDGMQEASVPGVIVGVWQPGQPSYARAFGVRDTRTGESMTTDLYMRIGSVSKTFITTGVLQLVDQGRVGLDDPISMYVPGVPNGDQVTVRELAEMRSGLYDYSNETTPPKLGAEQLQRTPEELFRIAVSHRPIFAPGAEFDYNNTNTVLLGLPIQNVTGQPLSDYIRDHLTQPLNMQHTVFPVGTEFPSPHSEGYTKRTDGQIVDAADFNASWGWAAGNMISTLDDMRIWAPSVATGTLLSAPTQAERLKFLPAPSEGTGALYGLGLENQNGWIGHNGNLPGYQSYVYYLPPEDTTLIMLVNTNVEVVGV
jgi:D-alanyl-D-alanine carboxypeptidase